MEGEIHMLQHDLLLLGNWDWFCGVAGAEKRGWLRDIKNVQKITSPCKHPTEQIGELLYLSCFHGFSMARLHDSAGPCLAGLRLETV